MENACKSRNQHTAPTFAPWRPAPAWSASTTMCGSAPDTRGLYLLCKKIIGFVAEMCHASYDSIAKTTSRSYASPRNESPAGRERLVSTICQMFCVAAIPHVSYDALPETSSPQLRQPRNESPAGRERLVSTISQVFCVAAIPPISYGALPKTSSPQLRQPRNESPSGQERLVSTICQIFCVAATPTSATTRFQKRVPRSYASPETSPPRHAFGYARRRRSNPPALTLPHLAKLHPAGILSTPVSADCAKSFVCVPRNWERGGYG